jgi:hypothetical protein
MVGWVRASAVIALAGVASACAGFKETGGATDGGSETTVPSDDAAANDAGHDGDATAADAPAADSAGDSALTDSTGGDSSPSGDSGDDGGIETVVPNLLQAGTIALDQNNVYVEDQGSTTGTVYQCPKTGCATPTTLGPGYATGIAVDSTSVYWNDFAAGQIVKCAIGGCANSPTVIGPNQPHAEGLSYDGVNLYWAATGSLITCTAPSCGGMSILATGQSTTIVNTATEDAVVYWISSGSVLDCPAAGCSNKPSVVTSSVANGPSGSDVFVKDGFAYFTSGNSIVSCPTTSACAFPRTIGSSSAPFGIASDGTDVYWLDENIAQVYRCPITGCVGSAEIFADQTSFDPAGEIGTNVALDGEYAYWADPTYVYRKHK